MRRVGNIGRLIKQFSLSCVGRELPSPNDLLAAIAVRQERLACFLMVEVIRMCKRAYQDRTPVVKLACGSGQHHR